MTWVADKSGNNRTIDRKYSPVNRVIDINTPLYQTTPLYAGEIISTIDTGVSRAWKAVGLTDRDWVPYTIED